MDKIMVIVVKDTQFIINAEFPFAWNTVCILRGMDYHKFRKFAHGILYHSSLRTSCSCLRDDRRGNFLLALSLKLTTVYL
jgi:hypothetical protein